MNIDDEAIFNIDEYLQHRGLNRKDFSQQVRDFFDENTDYHYGRLLYRDYIAECRGFNMTKVDDQDRLWYEVEDVRIRKFRLKWKTRGLDDIPIGKVERFSKSLRHAHRNAKWPTPIFYKKDMLAIARTLTYIRIFPPVESIYQKYLDSHSRLVLGPTPELSRCWNEIRSHPHWKKHQDISQRFLDRLKCGGYCESLWLDESSLSNLFRNYFMAKRPSKSMNPYIFYACLIFKYATYCPIESNNKSPNNYCSYIWNELYEDFYKIWNIENE